MGRLSRRRRGKSGGKAKRRGEPCQRQAGAANSVADACWRSAAAMRRFDEVMCIRLKLSSWRGSNVNRKVLYLSNLAIGL